MIRIAMLIGGFKRWEGCGGVTGIITIWEREFTVLAIFFSAKDLLATCEVSDVCSSQDCRPVWESRVPWEFCSSRFDPSDKVF
jgi:hypothetical protein